MATSIFDLLSAVAESVVRRDPSADSADVAVAAIGHLGRALGQLVDTTDQYGAAAARRQLAVVELARSCRMADTQWPVTDGRTVDLAAAAADQIVRVLYRHDAEERWAVASEVACAVRQLAGTAVKFGPYANAPALLRVQRLGDVMGQLQVLDRPSVKARACLDTLIPGSRLVGLDRVDDVAARLVHAVSGALQAGQFTVGASLTVAAAAESAAQQAADVAWMLTAHRGAAPVWADAADTWRVLQAATRRFDDGSRYATPTATAVTESALALHDAVTKLVAGRNDEAITGEVATQLRCVANQLPALASQMEKALTQTAVQGKLFAMARALPQSEERAGDYIRNRAVVVRPPEIAATRLAARTAGRVSAALAIELDRSAGVLGRQPQPNLIWALAAGLPNHRSSRARDDTVRQLRVVAPDAPAR